VPLVVGFAAAVDLCLAELEAEARRLTALRQRLWERLCSDPGDVTLNGHPTRRLPGNLNVCFGGVDSDHLLLALPDVALSTGSACSSARPGPSHVLTALGLPEHRLRGAVRFGLGRSTTAEEIDWVADQIASWVRSDREERSARAAGAGPLLSRQ